MPAPVRKYSRDFGECKVRLVRSCQLKSSRLFFRIGFLLIAALAPSSVCANEYERISSELSRAAVRQGKSRVAVLPFANVGRRSPTAGMVIAEKVINQVMARNELEVVERTLLAAVLREQRLMHSGAVDGGSIKELGRILGVDALVSGTVMELKDGRFEVNARLIDAESARILAAVSSKVEKDWAESLFDDMPWSGAWSSWDQTPSAYGVPQEQSDCSQAAQNIDRLDRAILDLKARYWAGRLKDRNIERGSLKRNPGSEIRSLDTRQEFYSLLRSRYNEPDLSRVTAGEFERMQRTQNQIDRLVESCGLSGV